MITTYANIVGNLKVRDGGGEDTIFVHIYFGRHGKTGTGAPRSKVQVDIGKTGTGQVVFGDIVDVQSEVTV